MDKQNGYITTQEAASRLGITEDAIRKRIKTGSIKAKKIGKIWFVLAETVQKPSANGFSDKDKLIEKLQEEVAFLRQQMGVWEQQLTVKDQQIAERDKDLAFYREQIRFHELQLAQAQERVIELPQPKAEQSEPRVLEPDANRNPLVRFWHWFVGK